MPTTDHGDAAPGWPTTGAARAGGGWLMTSRNLPALELVRTTPDGRVADQHELGAGDGAWGVATGAGDVTYLGLYGTPGANLLRVADGRRDGIARLATTFVWALAVADDGHVLGVGTGPALAFGWDPRTGLARDLGLLQAGQQPRTLAVADGLVVIGGATAGGAFLTADGRDVLPADLRGDDGVYCSAVAGDGLVVVGTTGPDRRDPAVAVVEAWRPGGGATVVRLPGEALVDAVASAPDGSATWATARPSGALHRVAGGRAEQVAVPVPLSETRALAVDGGGVHGVSADGSTWTHDPATGRTQVITPEDAGIRLGPQRVQSLAAAADRVDVAGTFTATRHDPAGGVPVTRFAPGEAKAMAVVEGTTYLAMYPVGEIWRWDAGADAPAPVVRLRPDQIRPLDLGWIPSTRRLAVTTTDDAGGHVLHLVDPDGGAVEEVGDPLGGGGLAGLAVHGDAILLGGSGPRPAIGAVDAATGAVRWVRQGVVPDGGFVLGLQVVGQQLVATTSRGWAVRLDVATGTPGQPVRVAEAAGRLRRHGDRLLLATGDAVLELDPATLDARPVAEDLRGAFWGWPSLAVSPGDAQGGGAVWVVAGRRLARLALRDAPRDSVTPAPVAPVPQPPPPTTPDEEPT